MKILQFAFGGDPDNPYLPDNYGENCVVYTGTHDNDTTLGWFSSLPEEDRQTVLNYLGLEGTDEIHWDLIGLASASKAKMSIIPMQDLLGLGPQARMNTPSTGQGNWTWRFEPGSLTDDLQNRLLGLTRRSGRLPA
jgi:4-alpha-glucanotransferase